MTGEYNLSLPNTVRTLFESLPRSVYLGKPCAVVCYSPGICAGKRAGTQARAFLGEMSCLTIGSILALPQVTLSSIDLFRQFFVCTTVNVTFSKKAFLKTIILDTKS